MNKPVSPPTPAIAAATPPAGAHLILDSAAIERCLKRIAHEIIERNPDLSRIALIGIPSRGVHIAVRLADYLEQIAGARPFAGVVDVSMHRDDLSRHRIPPAVERTELPRELSDKTVMLVDDVLFSGRTCRAAMDSLSSFGRPARIQYAVLIDRGHRELPIRADYVGKNLPTAHEQRVYVRFESMDGVADSVWMS
ncbi:MAG: bifunctional pyr operon transcriptional regulator/uracil phosphoribosyltransferase PyrR [Verrucomicrobiota bacterium]|nr:bifunctional pyr operon transcriptional regulator/uracil phosphoribosyltransferase PyrR [Verrucomicrobiota bacterium]